MSLVPVVLITMQSFAGYNAISRENIFHDRQSYDKEHPVSSSMALYWPIAEYSRHMPRPKFKLRSISRTRCQSEYRQKKKSNFLNCPCGFGYCMELLESPMYDTSRQNSHRYLMVCSRTDRLAYLFADFPLPGPHGPPSAQLASSSSRAWLDCTCASPCDR